GGGGRRGRGGGGGGRRGVVELDPEALAERRRLSYEELFRAARGAAAGLQARGVAAGARVGLGLPNGAQLVVGFHATWLAGGTVVPLNPLAHESEIEHHLADA